ncbi:MAG: TonB C-terminal domain-containing protein [Victivallales bacterium]|nr:TonB C-terminal domain-containing protein [Victivallales bacterium]
MKTASEIDRSLNQTLTILVSAIIHAGLMVGICCSATEQKEKPIAVATKLIELKTTPLPPSPKKETPPPKKETPPPKKETPPPPPPKKETPPPKPVEPPKPPAPTPAVVKTDTPKPVEQPKKLTRAEELRKQFEAAAVKEIKNPPRPQPQSYPPPRPVQPVQTKSVEDYKREAMARVSKNTGVNLPTPTRATVAEDSTNYAESYVSPRLYQDWNPSRAGMKYAKPSAVYITMTVTANGRVTNVQITTRSNDAVMNNSVEELIRQINSGHIVFATFQEAGINNRSYLTVTIGLHLKD